MDAREDLRSHGRAARIDCWVPRTAVSTSSHQVSGSRTAIGPIPRICPAAQIRTSSPPIVFASFVTAASSRARSRTSHARAQACPPPPRSPRPRRGDPPESERSGPPKHSAREPFGDRSPQTPAATCDQDANRGGFHRMNSFEKRASCRKEVRSAALRTPHRLS